MGETIEVLTERAKKHVKEASDHQTKADNATIAAGKVLQELKARITDKESAEGKQWRHSWPKFVGAKLKGECSYPHAQRLIGFVESEDPQAALAEYRKQDAAKKRHQRSASQTSERRAKRPGDTDRKSPRLDALKQEPRKGQRVPVEEPIKDPLESAVIRIEDAIFTEDMVVARFLDGNAREQASFLLTHWQNACSKARDLFCKNAGLLDIAGPRSAA